MTRETVQAETLLLPGEPPDMMLASEGVGGSCKSSKGGCMTLIQQIGFKCRQEGKKTEHLADVIYGSSPVQDDTRRHS